MRSTTFVVLQALALGALASPIENVQNKDTPKFDYHMGLTREQEGREYCLKFHSFSTGAKN
jgi:hypothetical protein